MKGIEVLAVSLDLTPLDLRGNLNKIRDAFRFVNDRDIPSIPPPKAKIVVFPELPICGHCDDAFFAPWLRKRVLHETLKLAPETRGGVATVTLPLEVNGILYHAAALMTDGQILGFTCSDFIPTPLARWFSPWPQGERSAVEIDGVSYPVGDLIYDVAGVRLKVDFRLNRSDSHPVDLVLIPGADPFELGRVKLRREELLRRSLDGDCGVVFANYSGNEAGMTIYDGGSMIAQTGSLLAAERRFSFLDVSHLIATVDLDEIRKNRPADLTENDDASLVCYSGVFDWGFNNNRRCRDIGFYRESEPERDALPEEWERSISLEMEEFPRAVAVGLYDYLRKTRAGGFVLSLSGGADSGAIAVMVYLMTILGFSSLGKKRFLDSLSHIASIRKLATDDLKEVKEKDVVAALMTTVYQRTRNNSPVTRNAAQKIAEAIGSVHYEFEIDPIIDDYKKMIAESIGRPLSWEKDDLALQNIQARSRGPSAWLLANLTGALLLSTGNRSEVACGYATMDGDSCGSISPIAGISKDFLRRWLRWMESVGLLLSPPLLDESGNGDLPFRFPVPAFRWINEQQPTAELRPLTVGQTDEADLMPYAVLDIIERGMVQKRFLGKELADFVGAELKNLPDWGMVAPEQIDAWIAKFERLLTLSQWKRYRYAPGFHLDAYDLSPVSGFLFPPISGGFADWRDD